MTFFTWFTVRKPTKALPAGRMRRGPPGTAPPGAMPQPAASRAGAEAAAQSARRKQERLAHRELLFTVVREAMLREAVLSGSYRFKVLSLDGRGTQFLVMVDLAQGDPVEATRLSRIETAIAGAARSRHQIDVRGVYWRTNHGIPQARPQAGLRPQPAPREAAAAKAAPTRGLPSRPPHDPPQSHPAELLDPLEGPSTQFEPLLDSEIRAFKQALARGAGPAKTGEPGTGPASQNYTLLTGFEDTELEAAAARGHLSATQYGGRR